MHLSIMIKCLEKWEYQLSFRKYKNKSLKHNKNPRHNLSVLPLPFCKLNEKLFLSIRDIDMVKNVKKIMAWWMKVLKQVYKLRKNGY